MTDPAVRLWCVVPAAGRGTRMGGPVPKQYLPVLGRPLLEWTLAALAAHAPAAIVVVVAPGDDRVDDGVALPAGSEVIREGGARRMDSVLAGLDALARRAGPDDIVLVHDAARPCPDAERVRALIDAVRGSADGGLLAVPVADTVKSAAGVEDRAEVLGTLDREGLWLAQTPQAFPFARLRAALRRARDLDLAVTDEASAVEADGGRPRLVRGSASNLKVTRPEDVALAEYWLARTAERADAADIGGAA